MVAGRRYWILIWYGMLVLGILGLIASVYWARRTAWRNVDEFLRGIGTILISLGMLVLLYGARQAIGTALLATAVATFVAAFIVGRRLGNDEEELHDDWNEAPMQLDARDLRRNVGEASPQAVTPSTANVSAGVHPDARSPD
ncbi:MAG: hypothetical protein ABI637_03260 [Gemmatimonadota bacterium]